MIISRPSSISFVFFIAFGSFWVFFRATCRKKIRKKRVLYPLLPPPPRPHSFAIESFRERNKNGNQFKIVGVRACIVLVASFSRSVRFSFILFYFFFFLGGGGYCGFPRDTLDAANSNASKKKLKKNLKRSNRCRATSEQRRTL